ncbi:hypothetical protein [Sphingobium sp. MI1205]|uniref:hypothetical protein n=1 Tax=Sphingobium sp. MI1205 TaxID=407020 RepID=UPI000780D41C|nr:hypothetical protein [Sphingobium sp. MI1205]
MAQDRPNQRGMTVVTKEGSWTLLPPGPGRCTECGTVHEPELPHNAQSLYYQAAFHMQHGRTATWLDAMEHCSDAMKALWTEKLEELGVKVRGGGVNPS